MYVKDYIIKECSDSCAQLRLLSLFPQDVQSCALFETYDYFDLPSSTYSYFIYYNQWNTHNLFTK